ncbi:MAG: hypothetical protein WD342_06660 [Verrucomicrobiales bacterium]
MKLLHQDFENEIAALAAEAEEAKVMIAFLTEDGLAWLPEARGCSFDSIVRRLRELR